MLALSSPLPSTSVCCRSGSFYFVKLSAQLLTSTITLYLKNLHKQIQNKGQAAVRAHVNAGSLEDDAVAIRECFERYVGGGGLDQPLKVLDDCVRLMCCAEEEVPSIAEELAEGRGQQFGEGLYVVRRAKLSLSLSLLHSRDKLLTLASLAGTSA